MYKTGITSCDELLETHIQGNIIPQIWFKTIVKKELKNPKPHLLAINILSDIVYWYRPSEIRDEASGQLLGYKKKFRDDMLQRSYDDFVKIYGYSTDTIKEAIVFLEGLGVIKREFRNKIICGIVCNNIMYINLNVSKLRELTYPSVENSTEGVGKTTQLGKKNLTQGVSEFPHTNTENTTKNTIKTTQPINLKVKDRKNEIEIRKEVFDIIRTNNAIPLEYQLDEIKMGIAIKFLCNWDYITPNRIDQFYYDTYKMIVECLSEMACEISEKKYNKSRVSSGIKVIEKINQIILNDGNMHLFMEETIDDFKSAIKNIDRNIRGYMKSVIWTSLNTYKVKFHMNFERQKEKLVYGDFSMQS